MISYPSLSKSLLVSKGLLLSEFEELASNAGSFYVKGIVFTEAYCFAFTYNQAGLLGTCATKACVKCERSFFVRVMKY